ncbi:MAG: hypothetical protein ACU0AY_06400 [Marinibacterium profundimaris]|uniref:Uncharacterized protein n=2 Tax=Marinibacterium profundimaris TaxID=1679460 RepID=A0A225NNR9_9RHOB|nr:hypothetical protein ATO3_05020 [Marinibacterium profundimaris]
MSFRTTTTTKCDTSSFEESVTEAMLRGLPRGPDDRRPLVTEIPEGLVFPLREMAPAALNYVMSQRRFSLREIKWLIWAFPHLDIENIKEDQTPFYEAYFELIEQRPALAVAFDIRACMGVSNAKMRTKIKKKPTIAMALGSSPGLSASVDRFMDEEEPMSTELLVAFFYDYASAEWRRVDERNDGTRQELLSIFTPTIEIGEEVDEEEDTAETDVTQALELAQQLVAALTLTSGTDAFSEAIAALEEAQDAAIAAADADELGRRLAAVQILMDVMQMPSEAAEGWIANHPACIEPFCAAKENLDIAAAAVAELETSVAERKKAMEECMAKSDFALLATLSGEASQIMQEFDQASRTLASAKAFFSDAVAADGKDVNWPIDWVTPIARVPDTFSSHSLEEKNRAPTDVVAPRVNEGKDGSHDGCGASLIGHAQAHDCAEAAHSATQVPGTSAMPEAVQPGEDVQARTTAAVEAAGDRAEGRANMTDLATTKHSEEPLKEVQAGVTKAPDDPNPEAGEATVAEDAGTDIEADTLPEAALFAELLLNDMHAVAARLAEALDAEGQQTPLSAPALRAASLARTLGTDYTPGFNRLVSETSLACASGQEADAAMAFGASLAGAVFVSEVALRAALSQVRLGRFGAELNALKDIVEALPFTFPPGPDALAELAGAPARPRTDRLSERLTSWARDAQHMSGPCQPSTRFLRAVAKPGGIVGGAAEAIAKGAPNAGHKAREAANFCTNSDVFEGVLRNELQPLGSRSTSRLNPASRDYLKRRFGEAAEILEGWLAAQSGQQERDVSPRMRREVDTLKDALVGAAEALSRRAERAADVRVFDAALSEWLRQQVLAVSEGLSGKDLRRFASEEEVESLEAARLVPAARRALADADTQTLLAVLHSSGIPTPEEAARQAFEAGAFATALRLDRTFGETTELALVPSLENAQRAYAENLKIRLQKLVKRVSVLRRLDLDKARQESLPARSARLREALDEVTALADGDGPLTDLDATTVFCVGFEAECDEAEAEVRADQLDRVQKRLGDASEEDRAELRRQIESGHALEGIENSIALLRDGRALGAPVSDEGGPMGRFSKEVLSAIEAGSWPKTADAYAAAFAAEAGPLVTDAARRENAAQLMEIVCALRTESRKSIPSAKSIQNALEALGFRNVRLGAAERGQGPRTQVWSLSLAADCTPQPAKSWFLPPIFGSASGQRYKLIFAAVDVMPEVIVDALSEDVPAFVLVAGVLSRALRQEFAEKLRGARRPAVLIDEALAAFAASQRTARLEILFACGLPYGFVEPYVTNAGNLPPEMFFGRGEEIRLIKSRDYEGCLVFGGRQLGKSALLNHVRETTHDPDAGQIVVLRSVTNLGQPDTPSSTVWRILHSELFPFAGVVQPGSLGNAEATANDIQTWLGRDGSRRILALLDETDEFMSAESASGFPEITRLKDLMERTGRRFKVVFAGVHNVQRLHKVTNSPLAHFRQPIVVGPLNRTHEDKQAARDLVIQPLRAAGYRFEDPSAVDEILAYTNEYPSLAQEFLQGLLRQLNRAATRSDHLNPNGPLWQVPSAMLFEHERFEQIENEIRKKFRWTLDLDIRYALIANVLGQLAHQGSEQNVLMEGIPLHDIYEAVQDFWPPALDRMDPAGFGVILDEMYDLGVLGRIQVGSSQVYRYCLRSPQVVKMLGQPEDVENELLNIAHSEPAVRYDKAIHRLSIQAKRDGARRYHLPLTVLQVERLLDPNDLAPRVICGLKVLGLERVATMLDRVSREMALPGLAPGKYVEVVATDGQTELRAALDARITANTVRVVAHMNSGSEKDAERVLNFLSRHEAVLSGKIRPILLLDAEHDGLRNLAIRQGNAAAFLAPWGMEFLRMHLRQVEANHLDQPAIREAIMTATGGVPDLVVRAVQGLRAEEKPLEAVAHLAKAVDKLGALRITDAMKQALELIVDNPRTQKDAPEDHFDTIDELIKDTTGADLTTLGPDLKALGLLRAFVPARKVVEASSLGALVRRTALAQ